MTTLTKEKIEFPGFKHYVFRPEFPYRKTSPLCFCTCGTTFEYEKFRHECPSCNTTEQIDYESKKISQDMLMAITFVPEVQDDNRLTITRFDLMATLDLEKKGITLSVIKKGWFDFDYEKQSAVSYKLQQGKFRKLASPEDLVKFPSRNHIRLPRRLDIHILQTCDRFFTRTGFKEWFLNYLPHAHRSLLTIEHALQFIGYWSRNPKIEALVKTRRFALAYECIKQNIPLETVLGEKKMFALPKHVLTDSFFENLKIEEIKLLEAIHKEGKELEPEFWDYVKDSSLLSKTPLQLLLDVIGLGFTNKQIHDYLVRADEFQAIPPQETLELWRDYVNMAMEGELVYERFPKSLKRSHDLMVREYEFVIDEKMERLFLDQTPEWETYRYQSSDFVILPPASSKDVVNEGNTLNHCVASYVKKVAKRQTLILFVRKAAEPNTPYYTMEIKDHQIVQVKGYSNRIVKDPELALFIKQFAKDKKLSYSK